MSTDDKFGIGAGLMALGLAAGVILLAQLTFDKDVEDKLERERAAATSTDTGKAPQADAAPAAKPSLFYRMIPHRQLVVPEAIFDGVLFALALPAGIYFFILGTMSSLEEKEPGQ